MQSIPFEELATLVYILVDDWYQEKGVKLLSGKRGRKPKFSDSEVITLMLLMDYLPYPDETQYLGFIRANYLSLFPKLVDQSQYNRRSRSLGMVVEELRRHWANLLGVLEQSDYLLDTKPIPVVGYKRSKGRSDFAGSADYGHCASRNMKYFGYKLVLLSTVNGVPVVYDLVPANTDERDAADVVLDKLWHSDVFADKGFIGDEWQNKHLDAQGNRIWTPKRVNQLIQNPVAFDRWLNRLRERIEGAFNELQNTGRNLERLLRKTVVGLSAHVIAKVASHTLKLLLRRHFGIDVQTFSLSD
ncbi:IS982 family transposase [Chloroflexi bacterium TSY]|nr:IS982 family transposase [Chloroflexi bacterium TSY]